MNRRRFIAVAAAALAAPAAEAAAAETVRWRGVALGAEASIAVRGDPAAARRAIAAARAVMEEAEALFSLHRPESALSRLNRDGRLAPPPRFAELLDLCGRLNEATGGRFDPTVQPLWRALATGGDVDAARALIGWPRVEVRPTVRLAPGQALTLNGIAQGYATDMAAEALAAAGFDETLASVGEFRAGAGAWRIGIEDPVEGLLRTTTLTRSAIATSSPAATTVGGAPHIFGPAGEAPIWSTVSVEADDAALADGLSTALCLTPEAEVERIARRLPGVRRITLAATGGDMRVLAL